MFLGYFCKVTVHYRNINLVYLKFPAFFFFFFFWGWGGRGYAWYASYIFMLGPILYRKNTWECATTLPHPGCMAISLGLPVSAFFNPKPLPCLTEINYVRKHCIDSDQLTFEECSACCKYPAWQRSIWSKWTSFIGSRRAKKPDFVAYQQQLRRSACASTHTDQCLWVHLTHAKIQYSR